MTPEQRCLLCGQPCADHIAWRYWWAVWWRHRLIRLFQLNRLIE